MRNALNNPINYFDPDGLIVGTVVSTAAKPLINRTYPAAVGLFDDQLIAGAVAAHARILGQTVDAFVAAALSADPSLTSGLTSRIAGYLGCNAANQLSNALNVLQAYGGYQTAVLGYATGTALGTAVGAGAGGVFIGSALDNAYARATGQAQFGTIQAAILLVRINR